MNVREAAIKLADATGDAYSSTRYSSWLQCAVVLLRRGYSYEQAEAILRSKWMRWAADQSPMSYGKATSTDLIRFLDDDRNKCTIDNVNRLVSGTL